MRAQRVFLSTALLGGLTLTTILAGAAQAATPLPPPASDASFSIRCELSHSGTFDPIVMPGMSMMSHLHKFFGNTTTNENSTGQSLLSGNTTCEDPNDLSAYWVPALYQNGVQVDPVRARIRYGALRGGVTAFPTGFKAVSGKSDATARWGCQIPQQSPTYSTSVASVPTCSGNEHLVAEIIFGECWDGINLDSADHISHLVMLARSPGARQQCPTTHPVRVPEVRIEVEYPREATGGSGVTLASGSPATLHADIFEAWRGSSLQNRINERSGNTVIPDQTRPPRENAGSQDQRPPRNQNARPGQQPPAAPPIPNMNPNMNMAAA